MTALTNSQQQVMETLKAQFNANYAHEYAHRDDVTTKFYLIFDLQDLGLIETLEDDKMFIRLTQAGREYLGLTVSEVKTEVSQAKADLESADHVVATVVENEGKQYKWFWNGRGWIEYLNEAKTYTKGEAEKNAVLLCQHTNGKACASSIKNEIDEAQRHAQGVVADEHRYVTQSKRLRQELIDCFNAKGICYEIPPNTSAVLVGVAGRGNVGVAQYGSNISYTVWGHGYGNGECKNVGTIDEVVALFN